MRFLSKNHNVKFVWLQFLSYTSSTYTRIVPLAKFTRMSSMVSACLSPGEDGIEKRMSLVTRQVETAPAKLSPAREKPSDYFPKPCGRASTLWKRSYIVNIFSQRAPNAIEGHPIVSTYIAVGRKEAEILRKMEPDEQRGWLISRY